MNFEIQDVDKILKILERCKELGISEFTGLGVRCIFKTEPNSKSYNYIDEVEDIDEDEPLTPENAKRFDKDFLINNPPGNLY